ncbi:MAG: hypothetical protein E7354_04780 [Clostridiales bacterium]|nr:hypothetical protein [Clostridiales bacterium]
MKENLSGKCESCGSELYFNPEDRGLKCKACGRVDFFDVEDEYSKKTIELETLTVISKDEIAKKSVTRCDSCGASFTGQYVTLATKCEYCGGNMVVDDAASHPDACVPFSFNKEAASIKFAEGVKKKFLAPRAFKKNPKPESIESIYVPAFSFSTQVDAAFSGELYENETDSDGDTYKRRFRINGTEYATINNVLVECSDYLTQTELKQIEPYYMNETKKFNQAFVYGYSVEYYNRTVEESAKIAREIVQERVKKKILSRYDYDGVNSLNVDYNYHDSTYSYLLLPTYRVNYKYKNKEYSTVMNGQTGKIGGNTPTSKWKIFWIVLGILAVFGGVVALFSDELFREIMRFVR